MKALAITLCTLALAAFVALIDLSCAHPPTIPQIAAGAAAGVKIGADVCEALSTQPQPEWIVLACDAIALDGSLGRVQVTMPAAQWAAMTHHPVGK